MKKHTSKYGDINDPKTWKFPPVSLGGLLKPKPIDEQLYQWIKTGIQNKQNGELK
jgi:hypothetical protein